MGPTIGPIVAHVSVKLSHKNGIPMVTMMMNMLMEQDYISKLQPAAGLLFIPHVI
jgi:hypothetical protein